MDNNLSEKIYKKALSYGYDDCGIIPVDALASYALHLKERIEKIPQYGILPGYGTLYTDS